MSSDFVNDERSGIVDAQSTMVCAGKMVKLYVWYDNEFAYSRRLVTLGQRAATAVVGPGTGGTEGSEGSGGGGGGEGGEGKA